MLLFIDFYQYKYSPIQYLTSCVCALKEEIAMRRISKAVAGWFSIESERGVTAIEYGLIASLVALAIIVGITALGVNLNALFTYIAGKVNPPS
jgi:pilus assembly protein Flp/PilA